MLLRALSGQKGRIRVDKSTVAALFMKCTGMRCEVREMASGSVSGLLSSGCVIDPEMA